MRCDRRAGFQTGCQLCRSDAVSALASGFTLRKRVPRPRRRRRVAQHETVARRRLVGSEPERESSLRECGGCSTMRDASGLPTSIGKLSEVSSMCTEAPRPILSGDREVPLVCANSHAVRSFINSGAWLSLVRAPRLGRGGRRFESGRPDCSIYLGSSRRSRPERRSLPDRRSSARAAASAARRSAPERRSDVARRSASDRVSGLTPRSLSSQGGRGVMLVAFVLKSRRPARRRSARRRTQTPRRRRLPPRPPSRRRRSAGPGSGTAPRALVRRRRSRRSARARAP